MEWPSPSLRCRCSGKLETVRKFHSDKDIALEAELADITQSLMKSQVCFGLTNGEYRNAMLSAKKRLRLGLEGRAERDDLRALLIETVGEAQLDWWQINCDRKNVFVNGAFGEQGSRNLGQNAILIKAYFGTFEAFEAALQRVNDGQWMADADQSDRGRSGEDARVLGGPSTNANGNRDVNHWLALSPKDFKARRDTYRARALSIKEANLGRHTLSRKCRVFLSKLDAVWFDRNFPPRVPDRRLRQDRASKKGRQLSDEDKAAAIRSARANFDLTPPARRISAAMLLGIYGSYGNGPHKLLDHPLVASALNECVEQKEEYRVRVESDLCGRVARLEPESPLAQADGFLGLTNGQRQARIIKIRKWLARNRR
ncbi:hypothetical protein CR51_10220 [Caballeronia megalochromosomata]|nr:hypothetical protein CR51_10220 [Caballeronia megalochromosomata]